MNFFLNKENPLVSILLPVNRDEGFLMQSIDSILNQTYRNIELIIIANNCDDKTYDMLLDLNDERVKLTRLLIGQVSHASNHGIELSKGIFIARMDADDISNLRRIEIQTQFLIQNPEVGVIGSHYEYIDKNGIFLGYPKINAKSDREIKKRLAFESCLAHPTTMIRRDVLLNNSGYCYGVFAEDWELWLRLARAGVKMTVIEQNLLKYRIHGNQSTSLKNFSRNMGYVSGLLLREFFITKKINFLLGIIYHLNKSYSYLIFNKIKSSLKKIIPSLSWNHTKF